MTAFDVMLDAYRTWVDPMSRKVTAVALRRAGLAPHSRVLDVAAGLGALALPAAEAGHRVHAIDLAEQMLAALGTALAPYPESTVEVMDATALTFPDDTFDAAFSMFGIFFFGDGVAGALAEMRRVTRPGGVVVAAHWADPMGGPMFTLLSRAAARLGDLPPIGTWGFGFLEGADLERALRGAGCTEASSEPFEIDYVLPEPERALDEMHTLFLNHPDYPHDLSPAQHERLRVALAEEVRRNDSSAELRVRARVNIVVGHVPR
ncbi:class I SAM-dependent methyltransferase [Catenuloplanes japonicus]|uniref:class I SAM-dependent methyltransferase n=1 Tax=Catenuloplanes japonicus TaxID=33876 RepID=UPI00068CDF22|nr:class I SAM-dependent methyltransferase [Catenuloplanes japonicus]